MSFEEPALISDIWYSVSGIWYSVSGIWYIVSRIWYSLTNLFSVLSLEVRASALVVAAQLAVGLRPTLT